ncbi:MAG: DsbA family protein [Clostridia bacterium]|nr:DsbA family protein [Clostridia bacterium]
MEILFVSDYVCPYCLVAKEALRQAMAETGITPAITWHPYELTPEPKPQVDTYHDEKRRAGYQRLVEPCKSWALI